MSSSVKNAGQSKASNSVPPANSAWSKGPPQTASNTSRAESPASNAPSAPPSRRQSTLAPAAPQAPVKPKGPTPGPGHRPTNSINFGSIDSPVEKKPDPAPPAPKSAGTNGVKIVAPTPSQPAPAPVPVPANTPPATTSTPNKTKKLNVHALFQMSGGGGQPATSPAATTPSSAARGPFAPGPNPAPVFSRSPQISRPQLVGTQNSSGGPRPASSPRMGNAAPLHHHPHPMQQHHPGHPGHPGHPMQPQQWGQYYYPGPQGYDPYNMYWQHQPHQQHQHPQHPQHPHAHLPQMHTPPMQPSPRTQPAQPRPPSTPPVIAPTPTPNPLPPIITQTAQITAPSAPSPSLNVTAPTFVPGVGISAMRRVVKISTPGGDAVTFEGQMPSSPQVLTPGVQKRASVPVRMETEAQKEERLAKEKEDRDRKEREAKEAKEKIEREAREKEEAERKAKEEEERKVKEEEERKIREEEERRVKEEEERKAKEEEERRVKEEAERKEREEIERKAKEEEEARVKAEEERKAKEEEERKIKEEIERKEREELERKAKEEEDARLKAEAEAKAAAEAEAEAAAAAAKAKEEAEAATKEEARDSPSPLASPKVANGLLPSTAPDRPSPLSNSTNAPDRPSPLSISTTLDRPKRPVPGPLDLSSAQGNRSAAPMSALASARIIEDLNAVQYPDSIKTPNPDLNVAATPGKFRYDRDFLLQFMGVCKEKPDSLPPLDAIGLEPGDQAAGAGYSSAPRTGDRRRVGSMGMASSPALQRQASMGLGLGPGLAKGGGFQMGNFQSTGARMGDSQSRFEAASSGRGQAAFPGPAGSRLTPMTRSASQGGVSGGGPRETKRTRSQRGNNRGDSGMRGSGFQTPSQQLTGINFEPVVPLEVSENRWVAGSTQRTPQQVEDHQLVERKVKALLNKLTMLNFDSVSDQIITYANKSEQEKDGATLMQVIKLVFEKAKDEAAFSEMYARLCRKMMERVSPNVQDETIRGSDGQPITGGMLFRKYLLNRCQEDFERGWSARDAAIAAAASKADNDKAAEAAGEANGEAVLYSDEYYAAAKAKRQGLGLVRFIGELFKLQMLTERIMHECIKKLLSNVVNPEEEEIESLCKLLTTVGQTLDNPKARNHMDIYFERMNEMAKGNNVNSRMQFMLQDVIEFRARHWQARSAMPQPAQDRREQHGVQRGGSRRGENRGTDPDGWNVAPGGANTRPPARAGDLSQFGKISKPTGLQFGPTSVFNKKDPKRDASLSRANSMNMFQALSAGGDGPPMPMPIERTTSSRKASVDLGPGGSPAAGDANAVRKKLNLLPRTKQAEEETKEEGEGEDKEEASVPAGLSEDDAKAKVKEDVKEYLGVENVDEAILSLETLPAEHRHLFVDRLVSAALDGGVKVVVLAEKLFEALRKRSVIDLEGFERGLSPTIEFADDLVIDVPKTYEWLARFIVAAGFDKAQTEDLAGKIAVYGDPPTPPRQLLLKEYEKLSSA